MLSTKEFDALFSYDVLIAIRKINGEVVFSSFWNYSRTTAKYRNLFLQETTKEIEQKIEKGIYKIDQNISAHLQCHYKDQSVLD